MRRPSSHRQFVAGATVASGPVDRPRKEHHRGDADRRHRGRVPAVAGPEDRPMARRQADRKGGEVPHHQMGVVRRHQMAVARRQGVARH